MRHLYYVPYAIFGFLNLALMLFIYLINAFGAVVVWLNNKAAYYGDKCGDKARDDKKLTAFLERLDEKLEQRNIKI